jgi:hypothetical protein
MRHAEHDFDQDGKCRRCGTTFEAYLIEDYDCDTDAIPTPTPTPGA